MKKQIISVKDRIKASFHSKKFKNGAYSSITIVVIIIAVLFVNLIFNELDLQLDLSSERMYTVTDQTKEIVKGVTDDITIYYICQEGQEATEVEKLVNKYEGLSSHIKIVKKDPALYPTFTTQYVDAGTTVKDNSLIIVNESKDRFKYISLDDMIQYEMNNSTYQYEASALDIEGQITSAIQSITTGTTLNLYAITGHGEQTISSTLTKEIEKKSINVQTINTRTIDAIPKDCDMLMIYGPTTDYSQEEVNRIKEYLIAGGKAMILTNYSNKDMTNFNALLEYYGVQVVNGVVLEDKEHSIAGYVNTILPQIKSHELTTGVNQDKNPVVLVNALGLQTIDTRSTVTMTPILTSSDASFAKMNLTSGVLEKEEGDVDGPFHTGVLVSETYDNVTTELVVFSSDYLLDESYISTSACGNLELFLNSLNYFGGTETGLSIPARSLKSQSLIVTSSHTVYWTIGLVIVLPILLLVTGFLIWYRRRSR